MQRLSGRVSAQNPAGHYCSTYRLKLRFDEVRSRRAAALPQGFILCCIKTLPPRERAKQLQGQWDCKGGTRLPVWPFFHANNDLFLMTNNKLWLSIASLLGPPLESKFLALSQTIMSRGSEVVLVWESSDFLIKCPQELSS